MTSFPVPRGVLLSGVVMFCIFSGICLSVAPFPRGCWVIALIAGIFGLVAMFHPMRVLVSDETICVEYPWRKKVLQLNSLAASTWGRRKGKPLSLRFRAEGKIQPVLILSREVLGEQFEPLLRELSKRRIEVLEDTSVPLLYPGRREVETNGKRVIVYRGTPWVMHMALATCAMLGFVAFILNALPWDLSIAGREKIIVCLSVLPLIAVAIWFVPTVMGVVFKDDTVIIKRVWQCKLVLKPADIERVSDSPRRNGLRLILLTTSRGTQVRMFEGWLGSQPGELWKELAEFAGVEAVQTI